MGINHPSLAEFATLTDLSPEGLRGLRAVALRGIEFKKEIK